MIDEGVQATGSKVKRGVHMGGWQHNPQKKTTAIREATPSDSRAQTTMEQMLKPGHPKCPWSCNFPQTGRDLHLHHIGHHYPVRT